MNDTTSLGIQKYAFPNGSMALHAAQGLKLEEPRENEGLHLDHIYVGLGYCSKHSPSGICTIGVHSERHRRESKQWPPTSTAFSAFHTLGHPSKKLRLKLPQLINTPCGILTLPKVPTACQNQQQATINTIGFPDQTASTLNALAGGPPPTPQGEDCLTVNVQLPASTPKDAKLPVEF